MKCQLEPKIHAGDVWGPLPRDCSAPSRVSGHDLGIFLECTQSYLTRRAAGPAFELGFSPTFQQVFDHIKGHWILGGGVPWGLGGWRRLHRHYICLSLCSFLKKNVVSEGGGRGRDEGRGSAWDQGACVWPAALSHEEVPASDAFEQGLALPLRVHLSAHLPLEGKGI